MEWKPEKKCDQQKQLLLKLQKSTKTHWLSCKSFGSWRSRVALDTLKIIAICYTHTPGTHKYFEML